MSEDRLDTLEGMGGVPAVAFLLERHDGARESQNVSTYIACVAYVFLVLDHSPEHRVRNVAELESRRLFRQRDSIKDMGLTSLHTWG